MALSTTVFAPTVRAVQPAFIYNTGEARVYFSFSSFNDINDIMGLRYSIIDPNKKSAYGSNSMVNIEENDKEDKMFVDKAVIKLGSAAEYYFVIDFTKLKTLTLNQYYQIQIELKEKEEKVDDNVVVWWSAPSQATLIRPILQPQLNIDIFNSEVTKVEADELENISGSILYSDGSTKEYLTKYKITINEIFTQSAKETQVYTTNWIYNIDGLAFSTKINYVFAENATYKIIFEGETVNGYIIEEEKTLGIKGPEGTNWEDFNIYNSNGKLSIANDLDAGAIKININFNLFNGSILVQKASSDDNFKSWSNVVKINITQNDVGVLTQGLNIYDYLVKGDHTIYQYRFIKTTDSNVVFIATNPAYIIENVFEDIFLCNTDKQLAIKYNPNISGFKWVVQESITNSLGGKYPLIRRNGETKYRQFTLSGTLYFDPMSLTVNGSDSRNQGMEQWLPDNSSSLFININEALGDSWHIAYWNSRSYESKLNIYEQKFKDAAMSFLTDGSPKLFRSPTEGYMLVMLTNVSFTPNRQLGRRLVDFSATVTEFAEPIQENFIRYGIDSEIEYSYYVLVAENIGTIVDTNGEAVPGLITPYVSISQVVGHEQSGGYRLKLVERKVKF